MHSPYPFRFAAFFFPSYVLGFSCSHFNRVALFISYLEAFHPTSQIQCFISERIKSGRFSDLLFTIPSAAVSQTPTQLLLQTLLINLPRVC